MMCLYIYLTHARVYTFHTPTELYIGITNPAVMCLGTGGKFQQGLTYFVRDIILGPTVLYPKLYHAQNMSHLAKIYRLFPRHISL